MKRISGRSLAHAFLALALSLGAGCEDDGGVARDGGSVLDSGRDAGGESAGDGGDASPTGDGASDRGDSDGGGIDPDALMTSTLAREIIAAPTAAVASLTADNLSFATRLYRALRAEAPAGNLFFSPHSISVALAMTFGGARGETATQMVAALELKLGAAELHRAFNALDQELARRAQPLPAGSTGDPPKLSITNALWSKRDYRFLPAYLDLLALNYGAGMFSLDFEGDTEASRRTINRWVEDQTAGRISDLLKPGAVSPTTVLVLTNAVYFKGSWGKVFDLQATADAPFSLAPGNAVAVPTMRTQGSFGHAVTADYEAVQLPYVGGKLAMLLIAPLPARAAGFEAGLTAATLDTLVAALAPKEVRLFLPKFRFSADFKLRPTLAALGMPLAFGSQADFSGMNGTGGLAISDVVHQAFVAVDEKGTEAAAATAVVVGPPSGPPPAIDVRFDRPFLFLIRDLPTGAVLFVGRLADPR
jgi:serpin B